MCQNVTLHKIKVFSLRENAEQARKVRAVTCAPLCAWSKGRGALAGEGPTEKQEAPAPAWEPGGHRPSFLRARGPCGADRCQRPIPGAPPSLPCPSPLQTGGVSWLEGGPGLRGLPPRTPTQSSGPALPGGAGVWSGEKRPGWRRVQRPVTQRGPSAGRPQGPHVAGTIMLLVFLSLC